ncbi:MAG: Spermidine synthase [candidate division WWE3 bacterium GW2011_GWD2_42_34]|nr:MAG: Spermidine synthase [candidate division WWE3 bacterium GW2011_GWD2_42_34]
MIVWVNMNIFDGIQLPKIIYETDSKYNGKVQVWEVGKTRKIKVDKIDQSISHKSPSANRLVWGKVIEVLEENAPDLKNILILGLGGGTMAHLISEKFNAPRIVSVEIDPVMVDIAKKYFDLDSVPNHRIIIDDALRVVVEPEEFDLKPESFNVCIVDIFQGEKYPDLGKSGNFITSVKKMVRPGGLLIFNRIYLDYHQDDVNIFIEYLGDFLQNVTCLVVAGYTNSDNVLIYGKV